MKNKIISVIVNVVLCLVITATIVVGFVGGGAETVSSDRENLYYRSPSPRGVSLMFNVYENTDNVMKILDILDEYGAKATFFVGGCWADDNVDCLREIASRGHEVGSHGYFHRDHDKLSYAENVEEISVSVKLIDAILDTQTTLFAPPSGAFSDATLSASESLGLKTIMWSRDTIDWRDGDVDLIVKRATENLENGEFILMHPKDVTVKALPQILNNVRQSGYSAVTVSYNLGE